jgi:hypothetical protein
MGDDMAKPSSDARSQAELRFDRTRKTAETAQALIDSELAAVRAKTKRLKAARLAQEAKAGIAELDKKKPAKKKAAARKK